MNNYIYISGGGSGIGLKTAELSIEKGWVPVLIGRNEAKLKKASEALNNCPFLSCDLSTDEAGKKLREHFKTLDKGIVKGLVNNAGVYMPGSVLAAPSSDWLDQFKINTMSALTLSKEFFPELKESKGSIVNVSSTLGIRPIPNASAYSASKAAMNSMTQSMALEFAEHGIRVNSVCPGIVNTPIHDAHRESIEDWKEAIKDMQPLGRVGEPVDIAKTLIHLLEDSNWTTGSIINIDGGILLKS